MQRNEFKNRDRIYYIDNVRALALLLVIFNHASYVFCKPWSINIAESKFSYGLYIITEINLLYLMPIFFLFAGYFTAYSITNSHISVFVKKRMERILWPLFANALWVIPLQKYFVCKHHYGEMWLTHFVSAINPLNADFDLGHLWFLQYLVYFTLIVCVLKKANQRLETKKVKEHVKHFMLLSSESTTKMIITWISVSLFTYALAYVLKELAGETSWLLPIVGVAREFPMFLFGYYFYQNSNQISKALELNTKKVIGFSLLFLILYPTLIYLDNLIGNKPSIISKATLLLPRTTLTWILTLSIVMLMKKWQNKYSAVLKYISDISYPLYIIHQPIIIIYSYFYTKTGLSDSTIMGLLIILSSTLLSVFLINKFIIDKSKICTFVLTGSYSKRLPNLGNIQLI